MGQSYGLFIFEINLREGIEFSSWPSFAKTSRLLSFTFLNVGKQSLRQKLLQNIVAFFLKCMEREQKHTYIKDVLCSQIWIIVCDINHSYWVPSIVLEH